MWFSGDNIYWDEKQIFMTSKQLNIIKYQQNKNIWAKTNNSHNICIK